MHIIRSAQLAFVLLAIGTAPALSGSSTISTADKAGLQAVMYKEISRRLVEGKYIDFNVDTRVLRKLHPAKAHPTMLVMGKYFILCTIFLDADGKSVNVDFYAVRKGKSFAVFQTAIDKRHVIEELMNEGSVKALR